MNRQELILEKCEQLIITGANSGKVPTIDNWTERDTMSHSKNGPR